MLKGKAFVSVVFFSFAPPGFGTDAGTFLGPLEISIQLGLALLGFCSLISVNTTRLKGTPSVPVPWSALVEGSCVVAVRRTQKVVPSVFTIRNSQVLVLPVFKSCLRCR